MRRIALVILGLALMVVGAGFVVAAYFVFQVVVAGGDLLGAEDPTPAPTPADVVEAPRNDDIEEIPLLPTATPGGLPPIEPGEPGDPAEPTPAPADPAEPEPEGEAAVVSGTGDSGLSLRQQPSTAAARVVVMPEGAEVRILSTQDAEGITWYQVQYEDATGWASAQFIQRR